MVRLCRWIGLGLVALLGCGDSTDAPPGGAGVCGDGVLDAGEACDDGGTADCDGCAADCATLEEAVSWYDDADRDGYGDETAAAVAYCAPAGMVADGTDCDDGDANTSPQATEICGDGIDNDCSGGDQPCVVEGMFPYGANKSAMVTTNNAQRWFDGTFHERYRLAAGRADVYLEQGLSLSTAASRQDFIDALSGLYQDYGRDKIVMVYSNAKALFVHEPSGGGASRVPYETIVMNPSRDAVAQWIARR
ncbi:MAG: hypothetical protein JRI23_27835, partial [Deltaproteobacteria bacterium]|nr:hypothetical protein [Deltaproteobacteria bacterium]MBW2535902.1 hypothetical protein [Deltaproteobacteria bacterium]